MAQHRRFVSGMERRAAAILDADVAGYSRLVEAFEQDERRVYVVKAEEKCGGAEAVQHEIWVDVTTGQVTRTQLISGAK